MDKLFLLNPGFKDEALSEEKVYYCPSCATIEGVLYYYPHLREKLEIIYVDFLRPRKQIVDLLGEGHQGCPVIIIDASKSGISGHTFKESNGHKFIDSTLPILTYLADVYHISLPHP